MTGRIWIGAAAAVVTVSQICTMPAFAAVSNMDLRTKVVTLAGITDSTNLSGFVTRAEFAKMCVLASSYKDTVSSAAQIPASADVAKDNAYAPYVRIALKQNWMRTYLGGAFKPDEYITTQDAAKALLALLGYTDEDFTGDQSGERMAKFNSLKLNDQLNKDASEILSKQNCIDLFYNLLKTEKKDSTAIYGTLFDLKLTDSNELNPNDMVNTSLQGPVLVKSGRNVADYVPFATSDANVFLNGSASSMASLKSTLSSDGYLIVYYNAATKTIWAYSEGSDGNASVSCVKGTIENIYYSASDIMTPTSVVIDGTTYALSDTEIQFMFSINGTLTVGDDVVIVYEAANSANENAQPTITGAYKY